MSGLQQQKQQTCQEQVLSI